MFRDIFEKDEEGTRIIGFARSGRNLNCDIYLIRKCEKCNAVLEFRSSKVKCKNIGFRHIEYIICPNCKENVIVLDSKKE